MLNAISTTLWPGMKELAPASALGGIFANKRGYHNKRSLLPASDYSVCQFSIDRQGPSGEASAIDWTFFDAQKGAYGTISKFSKRLLAAGRAKDPRCKYMREFFGQTDDDRSVEGWDFSKNRASSSDNSHLWHIHISIHRKFVYDVAAMDAILSILRGESLGDYRTRLAGDGKDVPRFRQALSADQVKALLDTLPNLAKGSKGADVKRAQNLIKEVWDHQIVVDGDFGPATSLALKKVQATAKVGVTGKVDQDDWAVLYCSDKAGGVLPILGKGEDEGLTRPFVIRAQALLNVQYGAGLKVDGDFGNATEVAVKAAQRKAKLPQDGRVEMFEWTLLITGKTIL